MKEYFQQIVLDDFLKLILSNPQILDRLFYYFPRLNDVVFTLLIPKWYSPDATLFSFVKERLHGLVDSGIIRDNTRTNSSLCTLLYIVHHQKVHPYLLIVLLYVLDEVMGSNRHSYSNSISQLELAFTSLSSKRIQRIIKKLYHEHSITLSEEDVKYYLDIYRIEAKSSAANNLLLETQSIKSIYNNDETSEQHFRNCGLIFLHSYWNELFKRCDLLEIKAFKGVESQIKAVYLLHYLATFQTEAEEDDFQFLKILVGLKEEVIIPPIFKLNENEKRLYKFLLENLIKEWAILKSTSIETIQQNFLQRNGVIRVEDRTIDIYLEKSAFDVLLDHFPYNYSLIKLKWLDKLLCVVL